MTYFSHAFIGPISRFDVGRARIVRYKVLFLPSSLQEELPFHEFPRLRVEGEIEGVPVRGAWMPAGDGRRYFIVSPAIKAATGLDIGADVEMRFRVDDQDSVDVPNSLERALDRDSSVQALWNTLSPGKRRMFAAHVASARSPETERRRVDEALHAIAAGLSIRDYQRLNRNPQKA